MRRLLIGTCSTVALYSGIAQAQPVEEVIVTGYLEEELPQQLANFGVRVQTVTAEQLLNGGYYDVSQALQNQVPGLYLAPLSGPFDYVELSYQGSRRSDVLWLIDGVRINNRLYTSTSPLDTIPANMVERIEVLGGGQGLFYGTTAVAGVINVVTKDFSTMPDGAMGFGVSSGEGRHINGYFRDSFGQHQFVIYGSSDQADGFQPFRDSDYQPSGTDRHRSYDVVTMGGKYGISFGEGTRVSLNYQHTAARLDFARPNFIAQAFNDRDEDILSGKIDIRPSEQLEFFIKGYYHWWDTLYSEIDNDVDNPGNLILISDKEFWGFEDYGINLLGKYAPGGPAEFLAGFDYQNYNGRDDVFLIGQQTESVQAPFAQVRTTDAFSTDVRLAAGVRHNAPSDGQSSTIWNASGHWNVTDSMFIRGNIGTAFRLPDAYELYVVDPCCEQGNPNLEPEESFNVNASIGGRGMFGMSSLSWEAIGFVRDISNRIDIIFDPVANIDTFDNSGATVNVTGAQFVLGTDFGNSVSGSFSYTFSTTEEEGTGVQLPDIPKSLFSAQLDFHPMTLPFGASVTVNHVGEMYRDVLGRQDYGDYTVVDVSARVFLDDERRHRLGARIENIFDEEYATRIRSLTPDDGGDPYVYHFLGTPRVFHFNYTYTMGR